MGNNRTLEELQAILERIDNQTSGCDAKVTSILGCVGVMFGILLASDSITRYLDVIAYLVEEFSFFHLVLLLLVIICMVFILYGCYKLLSAMLGRLDIKELEKEEQDYRTLIFFGHISSYKRLKDYRTKLKGVDEEKLKQDYIYQIFICSKILAIKYSCYNKGMKYSGIGFGGFLVVSMFCIFARKYGF